MGLDMYLNAKKYVPSYKRGGPVGPNVGADVDDEPRARYNGVLEAAGLSSLKLDPEHREYGGLYVQVRVGYWRKANQIFAWFESNVCGETEGTVNCHEYDVSLEQLKELRDTCLRVLDDHDLAEEELPTQSGFFFGGTEIDDYYFSDLQDTVEMIDKILANPELAQDCDFEYHAWW